MADNCLPTDVNGGKIVLKRRVKKKPTKECAECHGNEHAEQHQQEPLVHSETSYCGDLNCGQCNKRWEANRQQVLSGETFTQDYDRGDGVFVNAEM